jgi:hypothetical protein
MTAARGSRVPAREREGRAVTRPSTPSAASPSLADRLRDVDEQNALVVRRRAADRIEELEAELVEQRSFLLSEVHRAEDERDALRDALREYANPQHWGISRDDLDHRVVSWIGPGAEKAGMPDAMQVAREALGDA